MSRPGSKYLLNAVMRSREESAPNPVQLYTEMIDETETGHGKHDLSPYSDNRRDLSPTLAPAAGSG